jgi:hypothetical protein
MAERPIFVPVETGYQLVQEKSASFLWHPGMAPSQKKKNVVALHESAVRLGLSPLLEVSTKSEERLGFCLSAFNLKVETTEGWVIPLESAFQGSKVFQFGGPFQDMYGKTGFEIKKDERLKTSGSLRGFRFDGLEWELEPKTAFYDWLYIHAVHREPELREDLTNYAGFTDIEFNPLKSINCQARSCALYVSLLRRQVLDEVLRDRQVFLDVLSRDSFYQPHSIDSRTSASTRTRSPRRSSRR